MTLCDVSLAKQIRHKMCLFEFIMTSNNLVYWNKYYTIKMTFSFNAERWCLFFQLTCSMLCLFFLQRLVVKPDQLIKRRGKLGLVGVNLDLSGVKEWLKPRLMRETTVRHPPSPTLSVSVCQLHLHTRFNQYYLSLLFSLSSCCPFIHPLPLSCTGAFSLCVCACLFLANICLNSWRIQ